MVIPPRSRRDSRRGTEIPAAKISAGPHQDPRGFFTRATHGEVEGVQVSFKDSLEEQFTRFQGKGVLTMNTTINWSGSNKLGKRLKIVNVTKTTLKEKDMQWVKRAIMLLQ